MINDFSKYPLSIYNKGIRALITFVLPFAFTAFYPANYLITGQNFSFHIGGLLVMSILLFCLALKIWDKGISVYESAGS
jgi:ABC-2 type transport system permease protein